MKVRLFFLLTMLILSGCKIQLSSSVGGSIATVSGSFNCVGGSSCAAVDVSDLAFDETFMAQADDGYRFVGWRRRDRGLCGGSQDACRLFTAGFAGNPSLLSFLDNDDEVFFLEAVFAEDDGPGGGSGVGAASSCWDGSLVTPGSTLVASYDFTNDLNMTQIINYDQVIEGGATFNGLSALKATINTSTEGEFPSSGIIRAYFQRDGNTRIRDLGSETDILTPGTVSNVNTITPYELRRYDLAAGESFSQRFDIETRTTSQGQEIVERESVDATVRFDGVESVTVPAGTFDACRFSHSRTTTAAGFSARTTDFEWFHVGTGVLLRYQEDDSLTELRSATVNGADI